VRDLLLVIQTLSQPVGYEKPAAGGWPKVRQVN